MEATKAMEGSAAGTGGWTRRPAATVLAAAAAIGVLMALLGGVVGGWQGHGLGHLVVAAPLALLLYAVLRRWPSARSATPGRLARRLVVLGLGGVVTGQLLEVLGARVDEPRALALEELAHTAGQVLTMLALVTLLVGTVLSLVAAAREGAVPWWVVGIVALASGALLTLAFIGVPSG